jgi:hypothetical protein
MSTTFGMGESANKLYYPNVDQVKQSQPKWTISGEFSGVFRKNFMQNILNYWFKYSKGRNRMPDLDRTLPGPNQYKPKPVHLRSAPRFSMGVRHSEFAYTGTFDVPDDLF